MNLEQLRALCLSLPHTSECLPFDEYTLVFKVGTKMFAYIPLESDSPYISLKCDPDRAIDLREHYDAIEPAYHMNKVHWNGLHAARLPQGLVEELIKHSYDLVWSKMTRKERLQLIETDNH